MIPFLDGASALACLVAVVFFARFWRDTGDRLFVLFAVGFGILAANRAALGLLYPTGESTPYFYLLRLAAFLLIAYAVIDKNRKR